jgi:hypothetical protein
MKKCGFSAINLLLLLCLPQLALMFSVFGSSHPADPPIDVELEHDKKYMTANSFRAPFYLCNSHSISHPFENSSHSSARGTLPFWNFGGSAVITDEFIRLTPSEKSRVGFIWNSKPATYDNWEVALHFKIHGSAGLGADGLAFWYINSQTRDGPGDDSIYPFMLFIIELKFQRKRSVYIAYFMCKTEHKVSP